LTQADDNNKIVIKRITRNEKTGSAEETVHFIRPSRAGRWLVYLLLIPAFMIMAVLGVFFFSAFLALFAVAAAAFGFRVWWLRRKMRQSADASEGEYLVIEDAEIVEERSTKTEDVNAAKKPHEQETKDKKGNKE
jgi:hypothetical protein